MTAAPSTTAPPSWFAGFQNCDTEHVDEVSLPVEGTVPRELTGMLHRIGPARHEVYGDRYRHWFDGDGMMHGFRVDGATNTVGYRNRYVNSAKKRAEDAAGRRIYAGFGTPPPGNALQRIRHFKPANAANTNLLHHAGKSWALCEGGRPYRIDPDTLETIGTAEDTLGLLGRSDTFTAHPHLHPESGDVIGFGMHVGLRPQLRVYRISASGDTTQIAAMDVGGRTFVHDFALTATRAIWVLGDWPKFEPPPVKFLLGRTSVNEALSPTEGDSSLHILDLRTGAVDVVPAPDGLLGFSHVAGAFDTDDGGFVVDGSVYPDAQIIHQMADLMAGRDTPLDRCRLGRLSVSRSGAARLDLRGDAAFEFGRLVDEVATRPHESVFGLTGFLGSPVRIEPDGTTAVHRLGDGEYSGEPVPVQKEDASADGDAWLLHVVLVAGDAPRSELRVLDGANIAGPPVATATLPHVVPFDFHGTYTAE